MRMCVCDACGMEFEVEKFNVDKDVLGDQPIEVVSFTCPKCDERYIVTVRDEESGKMQAQLKKAQRAYQKSYNAHDEDNMRKARQEADFYKRKMQNYMRRLKKRYLKELRRRGC